MNGNGFLRGLDTEFVFRFCHSDTLYSVAIKSLSNDYENSGWSSHFYVHVILYLGEKRERRRDALQFLAHRTASPVLACHHPKCVGLRAPFAGQKFKLRPSRTVVALQVQESNYQVLP